MAVEAGHAAARVQLAIAVFSPSSVWRPLATVPVVGNPEFGRWDRSCIEGGEVISRVLGPNVGSGEEPQLHIPPNAWQSAASLGDWTLVGCTVSPAFEFEQFELAPEGWPPA